MRAILFLRIMPFRTMLWLQLDMARPAAALLAICLSGTGGAWAQPSPPAADGQVPAPGPYQGPHLAEVDTRSLAGKVMCGYQGWFSTPQDGLNQGWFHYQRGGRFQPGQCSIDLWPDLTEFADSEKYATPFRHANGEVAYVYSSANRETVQRHFRWMRTHGIDGVFVQRFVVQTFQAQARRKVDTVLNHCREAANQHGRAYAVMYDLSGLRSRQVELVIEDWKRLVQTMRLTRDPGDRAYLRHQGRPLVAVWGVGFNDGRRYDLQDCQRLIRFFRDDPDYGGCAVMLGVPFYWRSLNRDSVAQPQLHQLIEQVDIVSPWSVGRYHTLAEASQQIRSQSKQDRDWCVQRGVDYLPVVFPGFSWHNMNPGSPLNLIPRQKGRFLWRQIHEHARQGATMLYVAMFDELDEGTAIFKCTNDPPVGDSPFLDYEGLPSDHYLWLTGQAANKLRQQQEIPAELPQRQE